MEMHILIRMLSFSSCLFTRFPLVHIIDGRQNDWRLYVYFFLLFQLIGFWGWSCFVNRFSPCQWARLWWKGHIFCFIWGKSYWDQRKKELFVGITSYNDRPRGINFFLGGDFQFCFSWILNLHIMWIFSMCLHIMWILFHVVNYYFLFLFYFHAFTTLQFLEFLVSQVLPSPSKSI